jgi:hypothetical protein
MWRLARLCILVAGLARAAAVVYPGSQLQADVDEAIAQGASGHFVAAGTYTFEPGANFVVSGASGFSLYATPPGVVLQFQSCGHGFLVLNASDVLLDGFTVDYAPTCFTQGQITAVSTDNDTMDVLLDAGYPLPDLPFFNSRHVSARTGPPLTQRLLFVSGPHPPASAHDPHA